MSEQEPVRIPKEVLEELESVRRCARVEVLDIATLRYLAMETEKPALVLWVAEHEQAYGRALLDGFARRIRPPQMDPQGPKDAAGYTPARGSEPPPR